jgi:hypothetical protein
MDQVYIPKKRVGFSIGSYVVVKPLTSEAQAEAVKDKPFFYNIKNLEPIKIAIISDIFHEVENISEYYENIIVTGSFLDNGFNFNDVDIMVIKEGQTSSIEEKQIERNIENKTGIKPHLILISHNALLKGLSTDPLYQTMVSRCVSKKRFVYNVKRELNYKLLDLHLLKSRLLIKNFDVLCGREKYELVRNVISISLFMENKRLSKEDIDRRINNLFGEQMDIKIRENMWINKKHFLKKFSKFYNELFSNIMGGIKHATKQ